MADISITAANIIQGSGVRAKQGVGGEVIGIGVPIAINTADSNRIYKATAFDLVNLYRTKLIGLSLTATVAAGQPINYASQTGDTVTFGAGLLETGQLYMPSATQGLIMPVSDMNKVQVNTTQITSNVATITTAIPHPFSTGQIVTLTNCGSTYNGGYTIASGTPGTLSFTVPLTHANDGPNSITGSAQIKNLTVNLLGIAQDTSVMQLLIKPWGILR